MTKLKRDTVVEKVSKKVREPVINYLGRVSNNKNGNLRSVSMRGGSRVPLRYFEEKN